MNTIVKTTLKLLVRNKGFWFFLVLTPVLSIIMLNVKVADSSYYAAGFLENEIGELEGPDEKVAYYNNGNGVLIIKVYDASGSDISEYFLKSLADNGLFKILRAKVNEMTFDEYRTKVKNDGIEDRMTAAMYLSPDFDRMLSASRKYQTPFILFNLDILRRKYLELTKLFPYAQIYYAVKANPAVEILKLLASLGSHFDVASIYELDRVLSIGVPPERISYGNTIKKREHVRYAYEKGIRLFASDSKHDLCNLAEEAPGSRVFVRILVEGGESADWPLSRKFGCQMGVGILHIGLYLG